LTALQRGSADDRDRATRALGRARELFQLISADRDLEAVASALARLT
jgi:hypothetical protein